MRYTVISSCCLLLMASCTIFRNGGDSDFKVPEERSTFRVCFYNTENLFDTIDDPLASDEEFLPDGQNKWNSYKYNRKLQNLAKVIIAMGEWTPVELIGLCEVENRLVLEDLIYKTSLKNVGYKIIHKDSPDPRGIDVAILYRSEKFELLYYEYIPLMIADSGLFKTREILYVKGIADQKDTLHLFINHWPSRRGGKETSESKRILAASTLRAKVDSVFSADINARILILGDFNDEPVDNSLLLTLRAKQDTIGFKAGELYNMMYSLKRQGIGSYKYGSQWDMLDQIIISGSLLISPEGHLKASQKQVHIFQQDWMMQDDTRYPGKKPLRTYQGPSYIGGYSDHLPVFIDLRKN